MDNKITVSDAASNVVGDDPRARERLHDAADGGREAVLFIFNTDVHLFAYPADQETMADPAVVERLDGALRAACARCRYFERAFSRTRTDSDISRAHAASPRPVVVAPETAELVRLALAYGAQSEGVFDITMGTVTALWDFHTGVVPSSLALTRALEHVGADRIELDERDGAPTLAITDPETILDLGGIAKGYIADDLAALMLASGVDRFVLNLGGNVLVHGGRPPRPEAGTDAPSRPWRIGIVNPRDTSRHRAIIDLVAGSVVTSGLQERSFIRGGVRYHHILDPRTGMPARTDVMSATIVAQRSIDCDGWSTSAFMWGCEAAIARIEQLPGVEAVLIDERDEVRWTSGIADALSLIPTLPHW